MLKRVKVIAVRKKNLVVIRREAEDIFYHVGRKIKGGYENSIKYL